MTESNGNNSAESVYSFEVDYTCASLARFPEPLVKAVAKAVSEFTPYAAPDRSYDAQAVLGKLWDNSNVSHVLLGQILAAVGTLPSCPLDEDPDSPLSRKRYRVIF